MKCERGGDGQSELRELVADERDALAEPELEELAVQVFTRVRAPRSSTMRVATGTGMS